ncbi:hypothetical protein GPJ56_006785 [Histomonas meleagridis]|uniref:uncharacterized protein n=1 Tax=Histomonas meleagridis TaxID=135588 RepID=UPI00355A9951|nr:hypothetical protein GPJ56_006785 [Histomonas meleagridis]KAH0800193.1 hypothetical protein GO595_007305 [Histomonas meleagridis]
MNSSLEFGSFTPSTSPEWPQSFSFGRQPSENHDNNFSRSKLKKKFLRHETHHKKAKKDPPQDDNKQGLEKIIENVVPDLDAEDVSKLVKELENTTSNIVKTMPPPFYYIPGYYYVPCIACVPTTNTNANPPYNQMCNPYGQMFSPYGQMPYPQMIFPPQQNIFPR